MVVIVAPTARPLAHPWRRLALLGQYSHRTHRLRHLVPLAASGFEPSVPRPLLLSSSLSPSSGRCGSVWRGRGGVGHDYGGHGGSGHDDGVAMVVVVVVVVV